MAALHNDEPALLDTLERVPLIEEVGEAVARSTPPQVFGVHGDWGLGKTSFLHQVQWYLTGECPQQPEATTLEMKRRARAEGAAATQRSGQHQAAVQAVWFDAWRYQNEEAPVVALLHEIRAQLSWRSRAAGATSRAAEVLTRGALLSLEELTKKIGFQYSKFRQVNREWESENLASVLPSHTLREHLCEAIRQLLAEGGDDGEARRLVVFIDDVDRCEPEAAYRMLEGLKIYLTLDNCVFVLGMNQKAIEEAIAHRMMSAQCARGTAVDQPGDRGCNCSEDENEYRRSSTGAEPRLRQSDDARCRVHGEAVPERVATSRRPPARAGAEPAPGRNGRERVCPRACRKGTGSTEIRREGGGIEVSMPAAQSEATQGPCKSDRQVVPTIAESRRRAE